MKSRIMRWLCLGLAAMIVLSAVPPADLSAAADALIYDVINADNVAFRVGPSSNEGSIAHFVKGTVVTRTGESYGSDDGYIWYKVEAIVELYGMGPRVREGYVRSDLTRTMTQEEESNYVNFGIQPNGSTGTGSGTTTSTVTPTPTPTGSSANLVDGQTLFVNVTSAYVRTDASTSSAWLAKLQNGVAITYLNKVTGSDGYIWYYVNASGTLGYIRSDLVRASTATTTATPSASPQATTLTQYVVSVSRNAYLRAEPNASSNAVALLPNGTVVYETANVRGSDGYIWRYVTYGSQNGYIRSDLLKSGGSVTVTASPTPKPTYQYLYVTTDAAPLRSSANTGGSLLALMPSKTIVKYVGTVADADSATWYEVQYVDTQGFVLGSLVREATAAEVNEAGYTGGTATATPAASANVVTITGTRVNMRQAATTSANSLDILLKGETATYLGKTTGSDGYIWYNIKFEGITGYVRSDLAKLSSTSSGSTEGTGSDGTLTGLVAIRGSGTNIRTGVGTTFGLVEKLNRNDLVTILGSGSGSDGNVWYRVSTPSGKTGYVRGDLVRALTAAEAAANNVSTGTGTSTGTTSLKLGMTGSEVTKLQNALIAKGYLTGSVTLGTFDTATYSAVKSFQSANGLYVDGIAGSATQTKLYGTSSGGTSSGGTASYSSVSNCELSSWTSGDIKSVLSANPSGIVIIDVNTKKAFRVKFRHGENHADVEPLTASDTAVLKEIVSAASNPYRIPAWVQVSGRTFAASLFPDSHDTSSDTISDNNFEGVFCVHFKDSKTHTNPNGSGTTEHQAAVQKAYDAAH